MREFSSLGALIAHLETLPALIDAEIIRGVAVAAEMIQKRVWEEIGHYQDQAGPFAAWADLTEGTRRQRKSEGWTEDEPLLRSGALRASIQFQAVGYAAVIGSNEKVAVWQELGTTESGGHVPPRSFLGHSAFHMSPVVGEMIGARVSWVMAGNRPKS